MEIGKGNVLEVARLAGIQAAKRTDELIPLCHSLPLTSVTLDFRFPGIEGLPQAGSDGSGLTAGRGLDDQVAVLEIEAQVRTVGRTGVEMEAFTAVAIAALTVYDMCKAIDRGMSVEGIRLEEKTGGKSGTFRRSEM
jgi:cyclic pyranopterin phosphate synthase